MTGFGHAECIGDTRKLTCEMKSVNNRYLDFNIRMPKKYSAFEAQIRNILKEYAKRGKVDVFITEEVFGSGTGEPCLNLELAQKYVKACQTLQAETGVENDLCISDLTRFPEVLTLKDAETDEEELWSQLETVIRKAAEKYDESRKVEGAKLQADLEEKLNGMRSNVEEIEAHEPEVMADYRKRLEDKLHEILEDRTIDESQLATALVVYADKNGLKRRNLMIQKSQKLLERFVISRIIYNIHSEQSWTEYLNQDDPVIIETLRLFHNEGAFPQKPVAGGKGKQVAKASDCRELRMLNMHIAHA